MAFIAIKVQSEPFDAGTEINRFLSESRSGGVATFVGQVRDFRGLDPAKGEAVNAMTLEHYPGMAERQLADLATEAAKRWPLDAVLVIHRFGLLLPAEAIVLAAAASPHRADAFAACEFLMDWLKTEAPFWKKEATADGLHWVEAAAVDHVRAERWKK